jgi:energy-coupling factor transporter ATP-binding protein EcfA2
MSRRSLLSAAIAVLGMLAAAVSGVASNWLAASWTSKLWLAVPLAVVLAGAVAVLKGRRDEQGQAAPVPAGANEPRNRTRMLERVRSFWVRGVLEQSLDRVARVELGLETRPDAVARPWGLLVQPQDGAPRPLPAGVGIAAVFEQLGQSVLILGAPGAGKTTLLLELARHLLDRAGEDPTHPIPVVFTLSSWAVRRSSLDTWLVEELHDRYDVPRAIGRAWVRDEQVLPLLDGLDEVARAHRPACVEAINAFRDEHGLLPLAVCSRLADYQELGRQLRLREAILVQPLTREQVTGYLKEAGRPLAGVRAALRDDPQLWELLESPLLLSIVSLAYQGMPAAAVRAMGSAEERRRHLFGAYVDRMLERHVRPKASTGAQTLRWLAWLAGRMRAHDQSVFYLEQLQPDWLLPTRRQQWLVTTGLAVILGVLVTVLLFPAVSFASVVAGMVVGLFARGRTIRPVERIGFSRIGYRRRLAARFGWGVLVGEALLALIVLPEWLRPRVECFTWSRAPIDCRLPGVAFRQAQHTDFIYIVQGTLLFGVLGGLIAGGIGGVLSTVISSRHAEPNQGIRRSARRGLLVYLTFWPILFLLGTLQSLGETGLDVSALAGYLVTLALYASWALPAILWTGGRTSSPHLRPRLLLIGRSIWLPYVLLTSVYLMIVYSVIAFLVLPVVLWAGGRASLQHLTLRILLVRNRTAPWKYIDFLDEATDRLLLRKVGGGYVFVHRLLLDYLADTDTHGAAETTPRTPDVSPTR